MKICALLLLSSTLAFSVTINVRNSPYNAVGDGVADDTAAVQAAMAACAAGDIVSFPAGTYSIGSTLVLNVGCSMNGVRGQSTLLARQSGVAAMVYAATTNQDSTISNLIFDMDNKASTAIKFDWQLNGGVIQYNLFQNGGDPAVVYLPGGSMASGTRHTSIDHNIFLNVGHGIHSWNKLNGTDIQYNYFDTFFQGVGAGGCDLSSPGDTTTVDHNTFLRGQNMGIELCGWWQNLSVSYNYMKEWRASPNPSGENYGACSAQYPYMCDSFGISMATGGTNTTVSHNRIYRQAGTSWGIEYTVVDPSYATDNIIKEAGIAIVDDYCTNGGAGNCAATRANITANKACGGNVTENQNRFALWPASNLYYTTCSDPAFPSEDAVPSMPFSLSNTPPTVSLLSPTTGTNYSTGGTIILSATASDSDGLISKVEFLRNGLVFATVTTAPYTYSWTNATNGSYTILARATDNSGAITDSSSVSITVSAPVNTNPMNPIFPNSTATDTDLTVACNSARGILTSPMTNSLTALTITMSSANTSKFCAPSYVSVGSEVMKVCAKGATTLTVCDNGRGIHGLALAHNNGEPVVVYADQNVINQALAEIKAIENSLGVNLLNVFTTNRGLDFASRGVYDIGGNGGQPRDILVDRDLRVSGDAYLGSYQLKALPQIISSGPYTLTNFDNGKTFIVNSPTDITINIPSGMSSFTALFIQDGVGKVTFAPAGGVSMPNPDSATRTRGAGSLATLQCYSLNKWALAGNVE